MTSVTILSKDVPDIEVSIYLVSLRYIRIFITYFNLIINIYFLLESFTFKSKNKIICECCSISSYQRE